MAATLFSAVRMADFVRLSTFKIIYSIALSIATSDTNQP